VLEHFTVDGDNTRVAVISYSTTATVDIDDLEPGAETDRENKCTLYARLDRLVANHSPYGYTATHDALQLAAQVSQYFDLLWICCGFAVQLVVQQIHNKSYKWSLGLAP